MPSHRRRHRNSNTEVIHVILIIPTHVTDNHGLLVLPTLVHRTDDDKPRLEQAIETRANAKGPEEQMALYMAAKGECTETQKLLLDAGAVLDCECRPRPESVINI
jgi:hypothetical protein